MSPSSLSSIPRLAYILLSLCARDPALGDELLSPTTAETYAQLFLSSSSRWGLPVEVPLAVMLHENKACNPLAVSATNDVGLMQLHTTGRPRQVQVYQNLAFNIDRGCEVLFAMAWGGRGTIDKPCKNNKCVSSWLQRYNPHSQGYGKRLLWSIHKVEAAGRRFDAGQEGARAEDEINQEDGVIPKCQVMQ